MNFDKEALNKKRMELDLPTRPSMGTTVLGIEAALAGVPGHELAKWMADTFNKNFTDYDRAIDAVYNSSHIGSSHYHHLIDGQHDIFGAFHAASEVKADDGFNDEALAALEHLARDTASVAGINPFLSLTPEQFNKVSDSLANIGISKSYFADAMLVNGPELIGGGIALCSSILLRNKIKQGYSPDTMSRLGGGLLLSSLVSANPVLLPIAAYGMYQAFSESENNVKTVKAAGNGALISGSALLVSSLVGGPGWLGCLAGIVTASLVAQGLSKTDRNIARAQELVISSQQIYNLVKVPVRRLAV